MVSLKTLKSIEYDKIMSDVATYAVLEKTKKSIVNFVPLTDFEQANILMHKTDEAYKYLFTYSVGGINYFDDISEELDRVDINATLNNAELLKVATNLRSARVFKSAILSVNDEQLVLIRKIANFIYTNNELESEITDKIISDDEISDNASDKLYSIRKRISQINAQIRAQLNSYMRSGLNKYLQDSVVTMRQDRYVIPVKTEFRSFVKGFIHDQSSSGATVFIEPEQVMELNNELKRATFEEREEIQRILQELSSKVALISLAIRANAERLIEVDGYFARAQYSYKNRCVRPMLNNVGIVEINRGRHPLINKDKVVPVSIRLGRDYNFLLITGPNTGGKTVTLKLVGLFSLMVMSGLYIQADDGSNVSIFNNVFCDIGDEQSIEQNLSTFSSHIKNIKNIIDNVDDRSLVLLDEIGAGTDPEEGSALALAIIKYLIETNCFGIITTHYSKLKEYALDEKKIENASMEFDVSTLLPVYKLNIGIPGSSNAIDISRTLGLNESIVDNATNLLTDNKVNFEKIIKKAEESRRNADRLAGELEQLKVQKEEQLSKVLLEKEQLIKEREKVVLTARQEVKRIVADKLSEAEEIVAELKSILKNANLESKEVFKASELKNRLKNSRYLDADNISMPVELVKPNINDIKIGSNAYVKSLNAVAKVITLNKRKNEVEVLIGNVRTVVKINDLYNVSKEKQVQKVKVQKSERNFNAQTELNVIGKTSLEALEDLTVFIDQAIVNGLEEVKIIHGVGKGVLLKEIRAYLKNDKNVLEYRRGNYGEGENGVTIVKLK